MMRKNWKKLIRLTDGAANVAVFMHHSADGDAIGSAYALAAALYCGGKDVTVFTAEHFESKFDFLNVPEVPTVIIKDENDAKEHLQNGGTLAIVVDCANLDRLSPLTKMIAESCGTSVRIDHHLECAGSDFADVAYAETMWSATCEGLAGFIKAYFKEKNIEIDEPEAERLYTGILTDTGKFVYSCTTGDTLRTVAELVDIIGVRESFISRRVIDIRSRRTVAFVNRANARTTYHIGGKLSFTYLRDCDFEELSCTKEDAGVLPSEMLNVEGVEVSVIVRPEEIGRESEKKYKVSMRCTDGHNVAKVCNLFGGGGHVCASGCRFDGDVDDFRDKVIDEFEKMGL